MAIKINKYISDNKHNKTWSIDSALSFLQKDITLFQNVFNDKKRERFYSELNILMDAGLDLKSALEIIVLQIENKKQKAVIENIKTELIEGKSFSSSMNASGHFSNHEIFSIKIGEESGRIKDVLKDLASYFDQKLKQKRQLRQAMTYPVVILITALFAVVFMLRFVVPMFAEVYKRFKTELPPLTKFIMNASSFISSGIIWFFLLILLASFFIYSNRKNDLFRKISSSILLRLPIVGSLIRKIYLARFCHSMNLLLTAKVPMLESIELASKMVGFYPLERFLLIVKTDLFNGKHLYDSLSTSALFDKRFTALVRVGEESNKLDAMFDKLSKQYAGEAEYNISTLSTIMEPVILIMLGFVVSVILVAMYLPMFKLSTSFGI